MSRYTPRPKFAPSESVQGYGMHYVYVYFSDAERRLASFEHRDRWPCKVGAATGSSVENRILKQGLGSSMARMPVIGLVIRCTYADVLERRLHKALRNDGRWIRETPSAEWFETSPCEVLRMASQLDANAFVPTDKWDDHHAPEYARVYPVTADRNCNGSDAAEVARAWRVAL